MTLFGVKYASSKNSLGGIFKTVLLIYFYSDILPK